ncbi:30S ribosomal protein S20 [Candidatus Peregrinibacteria bacterium]|nr:30S ribosomal protein S20 [Candidatus Peregrinibacteria bacterium]
MPIIKSAKKKVRQAEKHRIRNLSLKTEMKTYIKKFLKAVKDGQKEDAVKLMPKVYKLIDTSAKKHIIHRRNADNKKSLLARNLKNIGEPKAAPVKKEKADKITKKEPAKKYVKKEKKEKKEKK